MPNKQIDNNLSDTFLNNMYESVDINVPNIPNITYDDVILTLILVLFIWSSVKAFFTDDL